ncbi:MAG: ABC transporter ATP-binding protein [Acidobacteria bacterium]|nr:ABC transporter ATP-binding protein [Acidobacteriota bacterium]
MEPPVNPPFRIRDILRPHAKMLVLGFLATLGAGLATLLEPWPLKIVLDNVLNSRPIHGWLNPLLLSTIGVDKLRILEFAALAVLAIAAFGALCTYIEKYIATSAAQWTVHDLRRMLYSHIQRLSLSYHDQRQTGDLVSRVTSDIDAIQSFIASGLLGSLLHSVTLLGMLGVMFYINWRFTLVALSVAPVLFAVVFSYTRLIKKAARESRKKEGDIVSIIEEVLSSIRVVKAFAREDYEQKRLEEQSLEGVEIAMRARNLKAKLSPLVEVIVATGTCLVLWFGARLVMDGRLSAGSLILFIFYMGKMYKPMQELSKMTDSYSKALVGYERILEILQTNHEVNDMPGAKRAPRFKGHIEFDDVTLTYGPGSPALKNVSFQIRPGQLAAFVGPTGAGKTSIISLIPRFYDPDSGMIRVDGRDVRRYQLKSLRQQISFVLQDTILFHAPIWYNIAYGKPEATRAELLRAAELANAREFIEKMPLGYDTLVGERGVTLSGGQRQRIAVARAIVRNAPILILDEPGSGLDAASEMLLFEALDQLMRGKTSIVIAHRLSTIERADIIFVVDEGVIVEAGVHSELLAFGGLYAKLHALQFKTEDSVSA